MNARSKKMNMKKPIISKYIAFIFVHLDFMSGIWTFLE